jgi:hypothetical protein
LEARNHNNIFAPNLCAKAIGFDGFNAGVAIGRARLETCLPAQQRNDREPKLFNRHRQQGGGHLLAGSEEHIHLALGALRINFSRLFDQVVCCIALCGYNDHYIVSLAVGLRDDLRNVANLIGIRNRAAAKFLYNECHCNTLL